MTQLGSHFQHRINKYYYLRPKKFEHFFILRDDIMRIAETGQWHRKKMPATF